MNFKRRAHAEQDHSHRETSRARHLTTSKLLISALWKCDYDPRISMLTFEWDGSIWRLNLIRKQTHLPGVVGKIDSRRRAYAFLCPIITRGEAG